MLRDNFEIFEKAPEVIDPLLPFVYFDNAATMQRPKQVIEAESDYYRTLNANPLRGLYKISEQSTRKLEETRKKVAEFIGAEPDEIVFTKNATEGINLVANGIRELIEEGRTRQILVDLESHHSNILPFSERYKDQTKVSKDVIKDFSDAELNMHTQDIKIIALTGMSNVSGKNKIELIDELHREGYKGLILLDAAQLVAHQRIDVKKINVDFLVFSGHKIGSPMGIGVLYIKRSKMAELVPLNYGGEMVNEVNLEEKGVVVDFAFGSQKFEGGTINMGGVVGLGATIDFWQKYNKKGTLFLEVKKMTEYLVGEMQKIPGIELYYGENGIILFNILEIHSHDTAQILSNHGIMVRAGWHCAEPFLVEQKIRSAVRVSLAFYNTKEEVNYFLSILKMIRREMGFYSEEISKGEG